MRSFCLVLLALLLAAPLAAAPITYQGQLQKNGAPVNGDPIGMVFRLFTADAGGSQIGVDVEKTITPSDGLFQVQLNFGDAAFDGSPRYLEAQILGEPEPLSPRQQVTAAPLASYALNTAPRPANRITDRQIALLQWYQDPGAPASIITEGAPRGLAFDGKHIWATNPSQARVYKIDPVSSSIVGAVFLASGSLPSGIAFDGDHLWVANRGGNTVSRINPDTLADTSIEVGSTTFGVAFDGTHVWVSNPSSNTVSKIDPASVSVVDTVEVFFNPVGLAFDGTWL